MSRRDAPAAYAARRAAITKLLADVQTGLELMDAEHARLPEHWGLVGDAAGIALALSNIADRLLGRGEYDGLTGAMVDAWLRKQTGAQPSAKLRPLSADEERAASYGDGLEQMEEHAKRSKRGGS